MVRYLLVEVGPNDVVFAVKGGVVARTDGKAVAEHTGHKGRRSRHVHAGTAGIKRKVGPVGTLEDLVSATQFIPEDRSAIASRGNREETQDCWEAAGETSQGAVSSSIHRIIGAAYNT